MSDNDSDIHALLDYLDAQCLPGYRKALTSLVAERDALLRRNAAFVACDGQYAKALTAVEADRNALVAERDALIEERNALLAERRDLWQRVDDAGLRIASYVAIRNELNRRIEELEAKPPADSKYELTLLKIRNLVAEQEMNRSSSDREIAIGGWLYDHGSEHSRLQLEIDRLFSDLTAMERRESDGK
jgi:chromosome segregation ATPase